MGRFRYLEEMVLSDAAFDVEGRDLDDLFATAALALADLMVDPATVPTTLERAITLTAPKADLLLHDWLSELIFRKDRDREVFTRAEVRVSGGNGAWRLDAGLRGGPLTAPGVESRADPKAVTFHQFALAPVDQGWRARVVIDI